VYFSALYVHIGHGELARLHSCITSAPPLNCATVLLLSRDPPLSHHSPLADLL